MKKFLTPREIKALTPKQLIKYRKELKAYYPILKEHILIYAKTFSDTEIIMANRIEYLQDCLDMIELDRLESTEDDANYFFIQ